MATYRVELRDLFFKGHAVRVSSLGVSDFAFRTVLNGAGSFDANIPLANLTSSVAPGECEVLIYRDSTQVWGGYLDTVEVDVAGKQARLGGEGYWSRIRRRLVRGSQVFRSSDGTGSVPDITWTLISNVTGTQGLSSGDLGVRRGTDSGTAKVITKRVYCGADMPNIGEIIETFAEHGALDFEITPSQTASRAALWNTWRERGTNRSATVIFSGTNSITLDYRINASDIATNLIVYSNADCDQGWEPYTTTANATTYGALDYGDTIDSRYVADAQDRAAEHLAGYKKPRWEADVTYFDGVGPALTAYDLGDLVAVAPSDGYTTSNKTLRVTEREVSVGPDGAIVAVTLQERFA